jgi:hypothetical protein
MLIVVIVTVVLVGLVWFALLGRCPHLDADGQSALVWIIDRRTRTMRGWCPYCLTKTRARDYPDVAALTPEEWAVIGRGHVRPFRRPS